MGDLEMGGNSKEEMETNKEDEGEVELEDSMTLGQVQEGIRKGSLVRKSNSRHLI